jgi:prophage antirepressor-like protein
MSNNTPTKNVSVFEEKEVRRIWHNEQWYFAIVDVIQVLTDSVQPEGYIKDMRRRDEELSKGWGQIATPLSIETKGGIQKVNCSNLAGIFRIIQSIPSPKAEPFKNWLAKVGQERIEEIQDPERAVLRAKHIYEQKGHDEDWIAKRMRGINVRNTLTDVWKERGAKEGIEFAILTNEIYQGTFDMKAHEIKDHKGLSKQDNARDHMNELELILTMLGEATTTELSRNRDSKGFSSLQKDAKDGGNVSGNARKEIESKTGKRVATKENFLDKRKTLPAKKKDK